MIVLAYQGQIPVATVVFSSLISSSDVGISRFDPFGGVGIFLGLIQVVMLAFQDLIQMLVFAFQGLIPVLVLAFQDLIPVLVLAFSRFDPSGC